jgi:flagellar protein FlaI
MIVGGTASGKTTLLNAIAFFIPPENRVVSIEDTREINLPRENWLPSVVRTGVSGTGVGTVDMFTLLRGSFRQNPDYVIVGEVRGKEASVLFQGMASGHASISTMHADSVDALIMRLETPPINLSPMLVNGLDAVVVVSHAIVGKKETRRLREIVEIVKVESDGTALTNTPFSWNASDDKFYYKKDSKVFNKISDKFGIPLVKLQKEFEIRTKLIYALYRDKILGYEAVGRVIKEYDKSPERVLKRFGISSA